MSHRPNLFFPNLKTDQKEDVAWKKSFFKEDFSVDQCLSRYTQKSDLETLRRNLKNYGHNLQCQMSEILKTETEAIVNLAEYLTNLNSKIDNLSVPISQLREEIRSLYDLIQEAETSYGKMLGDIKDNNTKTNHIHLKLGIISATVYINNLLGIMDNDRFEDLLALERVVNNYSFQKNYMDELGLNMSDIENITKNVEAQLLEKVNKRFLSSFKENDKDTLLRCLTMYDNLQKQYESQETFRTHIVRHALKHLFTDQALENHGHDIDKIYKKVLHFLNSDMHILFEIFRQHPELHSFNFALNSFWKEFDKQSREGWPHITAPGNPELFQKRFTSTWNLLEEVAEKCGDKNIIRDDSTFKEYIKRFNLPVYFEIIYQQIAGDFETNIYKLKIDNVLASENTFSFKLQPSVVLMKALKHCFGKDIFIDHLSDQFLRLSMMLLSRYLRWFEGQLQDHEKKVEHVGNWEEFIIKSLIDLNILQNLVAPICKNEEDIQNTVFSVINKNMRPVILKVFIANRKVITNLKTSLQNHIIDLKIKECTTQLQSVGAIPRLYRRTNRNTPKEASSYMVEAVKPVVNFHQKFKSVIEHPLLEILDMTIAKVTNQYLTLVKDVLRSVCKTEESLRRLKSRTQNTSDDASQSQSDTMSDEMKIREQIKYDVRYFLDKLYPLASKDSRAVMDTLRNETC